MQENDKALGGMRHPRFAAQRLPRAYTAGKELRKILENFLRQEPGTKDSVRRALNKEPIEFPQHHRRRLRAAIVEALGNPSPLDGPESGIYGRIVRDWCRAVGDPDEVLATWLQLGTPIGIVNPVQHTGLLRHYTAAHRHRFFPARLEEL